MESSFFENFIDSDQVRRNKLGQTIYYVAFSLFIVISFLEFSTFSSFVSMHTLNRLTYLPVGLVLCKVLLFDPMKWQVWLRDAILLGLAMMSMHLASSSLMVSLVAFAIGSTGISFNKLLKVYCIIGTITLLVIMASAFSHVIANLFFYRGKIVRHAFGVLYPTDFAARVLSLVLAYYYLNYQTLTWVHHMTVCLIAALLYYYCDTRLTCIILIGTIVVFWVANQAKKGNNATRAMVGCFWGAVPLCAYLIVSLSLLYTSRLSVMHRLNHLLSGRLALGQRAFHRYGITLFGQNIVERGWGRGNHAATSMYNYFFIDSSYLRGAIIYGLILSLIVLYWLTKSSLVAFQNENYGLCAAILLVAISAFVEQHLFDVSYDPFILAYFSLTISHGLPVSDRVS